MWPVAIAPFEVAIVPVSSKDQDQVRIAGDLYQALQAAKADVLLDDRNERAGVKFNDATSSAILSGSPSARRVLPKGLSKSRFAGLANRKSFPSIRLSPASRPS